MGNFIYPSPLQVYPDLGPWTSFLGEAIANFSYLLGLSFAVLGSPFRVPSSLTLLQGTPSPGLASISPEPPGPFLSETQLQLAKWHVIVKIK